MHMDGQCFSCTEKFGVFRREHTCKNCRYIFCSKCLNHSIVLPNQGPKEQNVCTKCYKQLTAPPGSQDGGESVGYRDYMDPPENYKKRMAALAQKNNQSGSSTTSDAPSQKGTRDSDISQRVERLKSERRKLRGRTLSTEELEVRIQKLRSFSVGSTPSDGGTTASYQPPDQRTQHEQTQDLLNQLGEEAAIDARMKGTEDAGTNIPASNKATTLEEDMEKLMQDARDELKKGEESLARDVEITLRIANLKMKANATTVEKQPEDDEKMAVDEEDEEDEEAASQRVIQQILEQDRIEARAGGLGQTAQSNRPSAEVKQPPTVDPDEMPWCCICNEDATLRCHGCDNDLYCKRCFREGHDGFDLQGHRTSNYRPPKAGQS